MEVVFGIISRNFSIDLCLLNKLGMVLYCCFYSLWLNADIPLCDNGGAML